MAPATLPPGYYRHEFDSLPSTNAEAFAAARAGEPDGLWITAGEQTAGRGRRGRRWTTGRGNLAASLMLIDPARGDLVPTVSFAAAVALHRAAVEIAGPGAASRLALKWPNDLLLDRRKVAGILVEGERLENDRLAVVIGIGVNCVSHPDDDGGWPVTDFTTAGLPIAAERLFGALAACLAEEIAKWDRGLGFAATRAAWIARAAGIGELTTVNLPNRAVEGVFEALDDAGRLVLRRADATRETFAAGDVFLATAAG